MFINYTKNRGNGYQTVDWQMHCVMAMLFYSRYGHTNSQDKIGKGNTSTYMLVGHSKSSVILITPLT